MIWLMMIFAQTSLTIPLVILMFLIRLKHILSHSLQIRQEVFQTDVQPQQDTEILHGNVMEI